MVKGIKRHSLKLGCSSPKINLLCMLDHTFLNTEDKHNHILNISADEIVRLISKYRSFDTKIAVILQLSILVSQ